MSDPLFSVDSVGKTFGKRRVLVSASAWASSGRISVLLGRNGCGKSTLLRVATGAVRSTYGVVRFGTYRSTRPRLTQLAKRGLLFWVDQGALPFGFQVAHVLAAVRHHVPEARIDDAVEQAGIGDLLPVDTHELSGGERRRVELAVVLARRPRVLLADEPFIGVNPADQRVFRAGLQRLSNSGCAVLLTGHEVDALLELADDVIWMTGGATHHLGSPGEARQHDQFAREYLGPRAQD